MIHTDPNTGNPILTPLMGPHGWYLVTPMGSVSLLTDSEAEAMLADDSGCDCMHCQMESE